MPHISRPDLAPYVTLLIFRASNATRQKESVASLLTDLEHLFKAVDDDVIRKAFTTSSPETIDALTVGFLTFTERRRPSWLSRNASINLEDVFHCLVVATQMKDLVAICSSESAHQNEIARATAGFEGEYSALEKLSRLEATLLNAAFVGGAARTLWLNGIHRSTEVKADSKILSGPNLMNALNPLGDQTYTFSAARCAINAPDLNRSTIGVTPRKSRVWSGSCSTFEDFQTEVKGILKHLHNTDVAGSREDHPIPYLAIAVTSSTDLKRAYDLSVIAPALLSDDHALNAAERELAEKYAYRARFDLTATKGANFRVDARVDGKPSGKFDVKIAVAPDGRVTHEVSVVNSGAAAPALVENETLLVLRRLDWLSIYYESGHTVTLEKCFQQQFLDQRFIGWDWRSFGDFCLEREKPLRGQAVAFDEIERSKTLFGYTYLHWSRPAASSTSPTSVWLCCDDGANEIADFVRFEHGGSIRPLLSLIHVKGSHSDRPNRQLSVAAYEVVVGQAVKNFRALKKETVLELLRRGSASATRQVAWLNGVRQADRTGMIAALTDADTQFDYEVVIVQPSTRRSAYLRTSSVGGRRGNQTQPGWWYRRAQLDALLISAQATCSELSSRFTVVADDT